MLLMELSEDYIRKKLYDIATELKDDKLARASQENGIECIVKIIAGENLEQVISKFFAEFPNGQIICDAIIKCRKSAELDSLMYAVGETLYWTKDAETLAKVAEFSSKLKGFALRNFMNTIGEKARRRRNPGDVQKIVEYLDQPSVHQTLEKFCSLNDYTLVVQVISDAAYHCDGDVVNSVCRRYLNDVSAG